MNITDRRTTLILNALTSKYHAGSASAYGEPGYHDPEVGIILANWNDVPRRIQDYLEEAGFELEWSDEWVVVHDKAWRTESCSYFWEPSVTLVNGDYLTTDDPLDDWIEVVKDDANYTLPSHWSREALEEAGWERVNESPYESGLHHGMTDNPSKIMRALFQRSDVLHVLIRKVENSQFYYTFEAWIYRDEEEDHDS